MRPGLTPAAGRKTWYWSPMIKPRPMRRSLRPSMRMPQRFCPQRWWRLKGYLNDYLLSGDLSTDITNWINDGALIVNYSGHASLQQWAAEAVFVNADVNTLTNTGKYPFFISMSCLTGYFGYLDAALGPQPSLAEALVAGRRQRGRSCANAHGHDHHSRPAHIQQRGL